MFKKLLLPLVITSALVVTSCSSDIQGDQIPDLSQEALHAKARQYAATGDYSYAKDYLEALDSRYPFGELTDQTQLDMIYVYYKSRKSELTTAAIERYLRLNPTSQYTDYVLYMKGLNEIQKHGTLIQDYLGFDRSQKDPNSAYAHDAYLRLVWAKQQLAKREMAIATYYQKKGALVSANRHYQAIIYSYSDTKFLKTAFERMIKNYEELGLKVPAENARKVMAASHFDD